jgi:uncharacterized protein (TIRG00374 family)
MKSIRTIIRRLIPGLVLGFVVLIGLALLGDLREVSQLLLRFKWQYFLLRLVSPCSTTACALRSGTSTYSSSTCNSRVGQSLRLFVAGFPLAVTPGKVGEVLKGIWLNRITGLPIGRGISVVLAERISDGLAVMLLSLVGVVAYPQYWPVFTAILAILLAIIILSQIRPAAFFLLDLVEKMPVVKRAAHSMREFYEGSFALFQPGATLVAVLLGTISWLGEGIGFYFILIGLGMTSQPAAAWSSRVCPGLFHCGWRRLHPAGRFRCSRSYNCHPAVTGGSRQPACHHIRCHPADPPGNPVVRGSTRLDHLEFFTRPAGVSVRTGAGLTGITGRKCGKVGLRIYPFFS